MKKEYRLQLTDNKIVELQRVYELSASGPSVVKSPENAKDIVNLGRIVTNLTDAPIKEGIMDCIAKNILFNHSEEARAGLDLSLEEFDFLLSKFALGYSRDTNGIPELADDSYISLLRQHKLNKTAEQVSSLRETSKDQVETEKYFFSQGYSYNQVHRLFRKADYRVLKEAFEWISDSADSIAKGGSGIKDPDVLKKMEEPLDVAISTKDNTVRAKYLKHFGMNEIPERCMENERFASKFFKAAYLLCHEGVPKGTYK